MKPAPLNMDVIAGRLSGLMNEWISSLPVYALALCVVALGWWFGGWISRRRLLDRLASRNPLLNDVARTTSRWITFLLAVLVALEMLDATAMVGALLGTAGVAGIAIGFAFKDTLENYLAGLLMSFRQPFSARDEVVIDGNAGTLVALTSRATILMTPDGNHLRLPNALVFRSVILNYTRNPRRRFEFDVGIGVQEDLLSAQSIGLGELRTLDGVIDSPPPKAFIVSLGDSSVQVRFRAWVDQQEHDFWMVRSEAIRRVKTALEAADMDLPEPIYRLQVQSLEIPTERAVELRSHGAHRPTTQSRARTPDGIESASPDTRADPELDAQIAGDRTPDDAPNLLDNTAPRE